MTAEGTVGAPTCLIMLYKRSMFVKKGFKEVILIIL
jgi:hypothetical protein